MGLFNNDTQPPESFNRLSGNCVFLIGQLLYLENRMIVRIWSIPGLKIYAAQLRTGAFEICNFSGYLLIRQLSRHETLKILFDNPGHGFQLLIYKRRFSF